MIEKEVCFKFRFESWQRLWWRHFCHFKWYSLFPILAAAAGNARWLKARRWVVKLMTSADVVDQEVQW